MINPLGYRIKYRSGDVVMDVKDVRVTYTSSNPGRVYTVVLDERASMYGNIRINIVNSNNEKNKNNDNTITIETSDVILWAASL